MQDFDQDKAALIEIMKSGMTSAFWGAIVSITRENIALIDKQIIKKESLEPGHTGVKLTDAECDLLRHKRDALEDLILLPQQIVSDATREDVIEDDHDPYPKSKKDLGDTGGES